MPLTPSILEAKAGEFEANMVYIASYRIVRDTK